MTIEQSIDSFIDEFSVILKKNSESIDDQTIFLSPKILIGLLKISLFPK